MVVLVRVSAQGLFCCHDHYWDFCWWMNTINPFILNQPCCFVPYKNLHHVRKRTYVSCPSFNVFCEDCHKIVRKSYLNKAIEEQYVLKTWYKICPWIGNFISDYIVCYSLSDVHPIPMCSSFVWSKVWARFFFVFMISTEISADDWTQ
jgi:hypothetical protein